MLHKLDHIHLLIAALLIAISAAEARSMRQVDSERERDEEAASAVIPSPNQEFGYEADIQRSSRPEVTMAQATTQTVSAVPVYVSQYPRPERPIEPQWPATVSHSSSPQQTVDHSNYGDSNKRPAASIPTESSATPINRREDSQEDEAQHERPQRDLKVAASYGHGHHGHGHHGHGSKGWLKMGAYSGHKGAFGWHASYPVGGKKHGY